ncbi:hypothetical protein B0T22DRAFT_472004 [Podospora appendiculata]|uniref:Uncharacterized protein n=1 Tax=Podospora appendiculata TaxID=314037 RepID=A0AAE0X244_9PEZI|nr:hypothetical protein B0T22DRAFT_472004 [Podospora appendiculata]
MAPFPRATREMLPPPLQGHLQDMIDRALALAPTKTLPSRDRPALVQRQAATTTIATTPAATVTVITGGDTTTTTTSPTDAQTLSGGAIAGIVIGSIAGLLLLIWIIKSCSNLGAPPEAEPRRDGRAWYAGVEDEYPPAHTHSHRSRSRHSHGHRSRSRHSHRPRSSEVVEVRPVTVVRERSPRAPAYVYERDDPRGRRHHRSRSRSHGGY